MCGICGIAFADARREIDAGSLVQMNTTICHRGPDSDGFYRAPGVGLAARRLAIIDVSGGDQPISNESGSIHAVANGEIYNHEELRAALRKRGHVFSSRVDTEVIVHLYEEYGSRCVEYLRGMFAFALWDAKDQTLLVARDRVGKKPLFYAQHDGALLFGSELKCILAYPGFPRGVDMTAISHYLTLQYVPDPLSAVEGVHKLPPASRLVWRRGALNVERYWDLAYTPKLEGSDAELQSRVRETVTEAVRIRLMSDVPLGAHLSGGIDSSVVVGLMADLMDRPVETFSVGFREDAFSELPYARQIAEKFGTHHHELVVTPDAVQVLPNLVDHFDEPFADPAAIPLWYLAEFTRRYVTVALNGDGGDEAFGGYQRYFADPVADAYARVPLGIREYAFDPLLRLLPAGGNRPIERSYTSAVRLVARAARLSHAASVVRWGSYFDEAEKAALFRPEVLASFDRQPSATLLETSFHAARADNRLDRTLYTDVNNYLPGALLVKADRMTMAHSLEARSPFLDQQVLELGARLPTRWKVRGRTTKRILRTAFADLLPPPLARRGKVGFGVPLGVWFRGPLRAFAEDLLLGRDARTADILRQDAIAALLSEHQSGANDHGKRIWALLNLELWFRRRIGGA